MAVWRTTVGLGLVKCSLFALRSLTWIVSVAVSPWFLQRSALQSRCFHLTVAISAQAPGALFRLETASETLLKAPEKETWMGPQEEVDPSRLNYQNLCSLIENPECPEFLLSGSVQLESICSRFNIRVWTMWVNLNCFVGLHDARELFLHATCIWRQRKANTTNKTKYPARKGKSKAKK